MTCAAIILTTLVCCVLPGFFRTSDSKGGIKTPFSGPESYYDLTAVFEMELSKEQGDRRVTRAALFNKETARAKAAHSPANSAVPLLIASTPGVPEASVGSKEAMHQPATIATSKASRRLAQSKALPDRSRSTLRTEREDLVVENNQWFFEKHQIDADTKELINLVMRDEQDRLWKNAMNGNSPKTPEDILSAATDQRKRIQDSLSDALGDEMLAKYLDYIQTTQDRHMALVVAARAGDANIEMTSGDVEILTNIFHKHEIFYIPKEVCVALPGSDSRKRMTESIRKNAGKIKETSRLHFTPDQQALIACVLDEITKW